MRLQLQQSRRAMKRGTHSTNSSTHRSGGARLATSQGSLRGSRQTTSEQLRECPALHGYCCRVCGRACREGSRAHQWLSIRPTAWHTQQSKPEAGAPCRATAPLQRSRGIKAAASGRIGGGSRSGGSRRVPCSSLHPGAPVHCRRSRHVMREVLEGFHSSPLLPPAAACPSCPSGRTANSRRCSSPSSPGPSAPPAAAAAAPSAPSATTGTGRGCCCCCCCRGDTAPLVLPPSQSVSELPWRHSCAARSSGASSTQ